MAAQFLKSLAALPAGLLLSKSTKIIMAPRHPKHTIARPIGAARVSGRPHDDILAVARELAKRAARADHEAEIAARLAATPASEPRL